MDDITQEEAVQVADWLGVTKSFYNCWDINHEAICFRQGQFIIQVRDENLFKRWLLSPEGQSAITKKAAIYSGSVLFSYCDDGKWWCGVGSNLDIEAETEELALIKAVLEMLKGGE